MVLLAEYVAQVIGMAHAPLDIVATQVVPHQVPLGGIEVEAVQVSGRLSLGQSGEDHAVQAVPKELVAEELE